MSRRAETLDVVRPRSGSSPVHLLVDSTGLKLCSSGEWLLEKHGTRIRRSWRKLHIAVNADTGPIAAAALTTRDVDGASQVGPSLDQVDGPVISFTADDAYDQDGVYRQVVAFYPEASVIVPPRSSAGPSERAETTPTMGDRHLQTIAEHGRMVWQKASGYNRRALAEADSSRFERVIGDGLRSRTDRRKATDVAIAVDALNRMRELGRPDHVASRDSKAIRPDSGQALTRATKSCRVTAELAPSLAPALRSTGVATPLSRLASPGRVVSGRT